MADSSVIAAAEKRGWGSRLRVVVHDYSGHPFQVELSRGLAHRSTEDQIFHLYCADHVGGKGNLGRGCTDPPNLEIRALTTSRKVHRYRPLSRLCHELAYSFTAATALRTIRPDVVIHSNVPLLAHWLLMRLTSFPAIFWHQDVYSAAIRSALSKRLPFLGEKFARVADRMERDVAIRSSIIVAISDAFCPVYRRWGLKMENIFQMANWAPIDELPVLPRHNLWSAEVDLDASFVAMYSGTLGLKHHPSLLSTLAERLSARSNQLVVVISEGLGREFLEEEITKRKLRNLRLLDFQGYDQLPLALGSADVLLAILDPEASKYSVPSKVLTYMCAGKPIVALVPPDNQAALAIQTANAGFVVNDTLQFVEAVQRLRDDESLRVQQGRNARRYAEQTFDIARTVSRWQDLVVLAGSCG